jgi:hypothetical protein
MRIDEAKLSALGVSLLAGVGLTLFLSQATKDLGFALSITVPVTLIMGGVMFLFASDNIKKGGEKPPADKATKGK